MPRKFRGVRAATVSRAQRPKPARLTGQRADSRPWFRPKLGPLIFTAIGVIVVIVMIISFFPTPTPGGPTSSGPSGEVGREVPNEGWTHVNEGTPTQYAHYPPASGPHYPVSKPWGFYEQEVPEGSWIHNLEHGGVVLLYRSQDDVDVSQLREVYNSLPPAKYGQVKMVVSPYAKMEKRVAVVAANRIDEMDTVDRDRIRAFYQRYVDKGPEDVP